MGGAQSREGVEQRSMSTWAGCGATTAGQRLSRAGAGDMRSACGGVPGEAPQGESLHVTC